MRQRLALLVHAVLALAACQGVFLGYNNVVDGFPIGDRFCSAGEEEPIVGGCAKLAVTALAELDRTAPAHGPVVGVELYQADWRGADGNGFLDTRSSSIGGIAVVRLENGTVDAFEVRCSGLGLPYCEASDTPRPPDGAVLPGV